MVDKIKKIWRSFWNMIKENQKKNSDEFLEEEEYEKFIKKVESRMNKIEAAQKSQTHEGRAQIALMFENAYTQKKMTEASDSLKAATWVLAIATGIFAYVAVMDSLNSGTIVSNLQGFVTLVFVIGVIIILLEILKIFFKFVIKKVREKKK